MNRLAALSAPSVLGQSHGDGDGDGEFAGTYAEARDRFRRRAAEVGARLASHPHPADPDLACDVATLGDPAAPTKIVISSGVHGVEGFAGSAVQAAWLKHARSATLPAGLNVVLVHAINPWAFAHATRTDERNVDVNRNLIDHAQKPDPNSDYSALVHLFHCRTWTADENLVAYRALQALQQSADGARSAAAMAAGQSSHPDGLYYQGDAPSWSSEVLNTVLIEVLPAAQTLVWIDLHAGVGDFGEIVSIDFSPPAASGGVGSRPWLSAVPITAADSAFGIGGVPPYRGVVARHVGQRAADIGVKAACFVVEFGTVDDFTMFRADRLDRWLRYEGRLDPRHDALRREYRDAYVPPSPTWREFVVRQGVALLAGAIFEAGDAYVTGSEQSGCVE